MICYRRYVIEHDYRSGPFAWTFQHEEFCGPGDQRTGWAYSLTEALDAIDEIEDEL